MGHANKIMEPIGIENPYIYLSVVVPAHNESMALPTLIQRLSRALDHPEESYEVIVVDDGSTDGTFSLVCQLSHQDPRVKGIRLARRFGKEAALLAGLAHARGRAVVTIDADIEQPPELIGAMMREWENGAQIVHGVKTGGDLGPFWYRWCRGAFNRLTSNAIGIDMQGSSDYKLIDSEILAVYLAHFQERDRFYRGLVAAMGYRQVSVQYAVSRDAARSSRWRMGQLFRYGLHSVVSFSSLPLTIIPMLSLLMLATALVLGTEALISKLNGNAISGFATLEITLLLVGSFVMIGLGILGQYLSQIYGEVKRRPIYLVAQAIGFDKQA